jgi:hypothetical protein
MLPPGPIFGHATKRGRSRLSNSASKSQSVLSGASLPEGLVVSYAPIVLDYIHRDYRLAGYFGITNLYVQKVSSS